MHEQPIIRLQIGSNAKKNSFNTINYCAIVSKS